MRAMIGLASKYVLYHRWKTMVSAFAISLCVFTPLSVEMIVDEFELTLASRSAATPLVIGSKGSRFDLAFHAMHFETSPPTTCVMNDWRMIVESNLAFAVPVHAAFKARGFPIVGTNLDYFEFRQLKIAAGSHVQRLGDCMLGASVATELGLEPGDRLISDPDNFLDFVGSYPLNMNVTGTLKPANSPDDKAVFVDVKTSWLIAGYGHGHEDVNVQNGSKRDDVIEQSVDAQPVEENRPENQSANRIVVSDSLMQYQEVTDENVSSFHFHGDEANLPLTAVIAQAFDQRSETILEGRFVGPHVRTQLVRPNEVFSEVMTIVVRIKDLIQLVGYMLVIITVLYFMVVIALTKKLREAELSTMAKLGCSRRFLMGLQVTEQALVLLVGLAMSTAMLALASIATPKVVALWLSVI